MGRRLGTTLSAVLVCILLLVFSVPQARSSEMSTSGWSRAYGGVYDDRAFSMVQATGGGYAVAGNTESFGVGGSDCYLVKTNASGNSQWSKTYGGTGDDYANALVQTSDGGYALAGYTKYSDYLGEDLLLVKTDASGSLSWIKTYGGTGDDRGNSVIQTSDGGYAVAGVLFSLVTGGDFWLVKTDSSGNMQWNKTYGGANWASASSVVQTSGGGYALAGGKTSDDTDGNFWLVKTDSSGNMQWNKTYGGADYEWANSMIQTSDGGYALAGYTEFGNNYENFLLVKTDSYGNMQWNKTYGGTDASYWANSVIQTSDGGCALVGNIKRIYGELASSDAWLVKTDSSGNMQWNKTYGGTGDDLADSVVQTSDGGYALAGFTDSSGAGRYDAWLVKTDENGLVPEFPSFLILPLFMIATLFAIIVYRREH